jgi:hypothetical protein
LHSLEDNDFTRRQHARIRRRQLDVLRPHNHVYRDSSPKSKSTQSKLRPSKRTSLSRSSFPAKCCCRDEWATKGIFGSFKISKAFRSSGCALLHDDNGVLMVSASPDRALHNEGDAKLLLHVFSSSSISCAL